MEDSDAEVGTGALSFDGVNDRAIVADGGGLELPSVTLSAWVRADPEDAPTSRTVIAEKGSFECGQPSFGLYATPTGIEVRARTANYGPTGSRLDADVVHVNLWDGAWHLVSFGSRRVCPARGRRSTARQCGSFTVRARSGSTVRLTPVSRSADPVDADCPGYFHGDIDDVRIYPDGAAEDSIYELVPPTATTTTIETTGPYKPDRTRSSRPT